MMDTDFDFKPINEGLGFHRKVKPLEAETDSDEMFSFSSLGPGTLQQPKVEANSREQSKGLLSSGAGTGNSGPANLSTTVAKSKHNAKSVSDLIAALPPSLDFLLDDSKSAGMASETARAATSKSAPSPASLRKSPLFSQPSGIATPGAPAAASMAVSPANESTANEKRGFLKMPLGRNDYTAAKKNPSSLDENVAKTFPSVFPHLGSLAGKPATAAATAKVSAHVAAAKAAAMGTLSGPSMMTPSMTSNATAVVAPIEMTEVNRERPLAAHFGSAILDTLVAIALGCVLLALALSITNVNLLALLENSQTDRETIAALALLFISGGLLYVLAARSFVGATLGEWSYEIRVGEQSMRTRWFYPVLVVWRGLLVAATGFIVLPVVSLIAGRDVLKYVTGLGLVSSDEAAS